MQEIAVELDQVYKKFRRGELYDSLRDLVPAMFRKVLRRDTGLHGREFWVLEDVSFQVKQGESFGIIGPNGAGKSTILKHISGIMRPTQGRVRVRGRLSALIDVGAGFHPDLTGRENVFLNGSILGMTRREIQQKFDEIVEFSGLEEFIDTPVKRYSSGMYARLGFSVAAHVAPDVLLIDEVLSVGDYVFQVKCMEKMRSILDSGSTVIFISHNLRAVTDLCERSILLGHGRVLKEGPTRQVVEHYMSEAVADSGRGRSHAVSISKVRFSGTGGGGTHVESGAKAWIEIEVRAAERVDRLSLSLYIEDSNFYNIFDTATQRLGHGTFSLDPGSTLRCRFEIDVLLAQGTYHVGVLVHRYDTQRTYARAFPAVSFFVSADRDIRGVVDLRPKLLEYGVIELGDTRS